MTESAPTASPTWTFIPTRVPSLAPTHGPDLFPETLTADWVRWMFIGAAFGCIFTLLVYSWLRGARMDSKVLFELGEAIEGDDDFEGDVDAPSQKPVIAEERADMPT